MALLVKQYDLVWATLPVNAIVSLEDQLSKALQKKEKKNTAKVVNLQSQQLNGSTKLPFQRPNQKQNDCLCYYCKKTQTLDISSETVANLNGISQPYLSSSVLRVKIQFK